MALSRTTKRQDRRIAAWLLALFILGGPLLAACGGGGNVTVAGDERPTEPERVPPRTPAPDPEPEPVPPRTPAPDPEPDPTPEPGLPTAIDFSRHPEYRTQFPGRVVGNWGLGAVHAANAYARLVQKEKAFVAPGTGVTVGLIDSGIESTHWEFASDRVSETILPGAPGDPGAEDEDGTKFSHGTAVASLIAAQREGRSVPSSLKQSDFHGIAWGADLKMFAIPLESGSDNPYDPISIPGLTDFDSKLDGWFRAALAADQGVDILNMSFATGGLIENYDGTALRSALDSTIATAAQSGRVAADRTLLVWAAGNHHGESCTFGTHNCINIDEESSDGTINASSPAVLNALPVYIGELRSHSVSVVATQRDGTLADFSNRCGVAAKWCIAAPGQSLVVAYYGPTPDGMAKSYGYRGANGTSFAAPLVAGGLAVLKHYFRDQMGNTEVLTRLYKTADRSSDATRPDPVASGEQCPEHLDLDGDRSACELSSTHGHGLMSLDAATQPVGEMTIALGNALSGKRVAAASSLLLSGGPAGNALAAAFWGREVAVFDELNAPFWVGLDRFTRTAAKPDLEDRLTRFMRSEWRDWNGFRTIPVPGAPGGIIEAPFASTRLQLGINRATSEWWSGGHASLIPVDYGGLSVTLGQGEFQASALAAAPALHKGWGGAMQVPEAGILLAWRPRSSAIGMQFGALREFGSSLGTSASGAFGKLASGVVFAGTGFSTAIGDWGIRTEAELGMTGSDASGGIVQEVSTLATSAFSLSTERTFDDGGRFRFSLSQPLRVESGRIRLAAPTGRTKRGEVVRGIVDAPLTPSGRQLDIGADWRRPVDAIGGTLRYGATVSFQPDHTVGRDPELTLLAGYRLPF